MNEDRIAAINTFWFGELDAHGLSNEAQQALWFKASDNTDLAIRDAFSNDVAAALRGELDRWQENATASVALVLLLDQFTRNLYRGTAAAFAGDERALSVARNTLQCFPAPSLPIMHRVFLLIPFEHSESLAVQNQGLEHFSSLLADCDAVSRPPVQNFQRYCVAHRDVIERFGRFPHRNEILGRKSSAEELDHLQRHGGF